MNKLLAIALTSFIGIGLHPGAVVAQSDATIGTQQPSNEERNTPSDPISEASQQIWGCGAENGARKYIVDQLNRSADSFDMAIYDKNRGDESDYIGTVKVSVTQIDSDLLGRGETFDSTLEVNAFGRTVAFTVNDSVAGRASGRCFVQWQMGDRDTRRLVRQCLALFSRRQGGIAEVSRFGCTTDPAASIEDITNRQ